MPAGGEERGDESAQRSGRRRYWAEAVDLERQTIWLEADEAHHARRVMRARPGDLIEVIDGSGRLFEVEIASGVEMKGARSRLAGRIVTMSEPPERGPLPWLAVSFIRPSRLEAMVEGATQLGLAGIQFFSSARTTAPLGLDRVRRGRLVRLMRAATTQSLGLRLPELRRPVAFSDLGDALSGFKVWVAHGPRAAVHSHPSEVVNGAAPLLPVAALGMSHVLVVGPEGGLTDAEVGSLLARGAQILDLGPRRLRSETAAVAGLTLLAAALRAAGSSGGDWKDSTAVAD